MSTPTAPVTVVGAGYVGLVTAVGLARLGHAVQLVETGPARLRLLRAGPDPDPRGRAAGDIRRGGRGRSADRRPTRCPSEPGIILICVGTPIGDDGTSDLRQLDAAMTALRGRIGPDDILVIRSTLPVGGTRPTIEAAGLSTARVFTNPEFLRQGTAVEDFAQPSRVVVGRFPDADPDALAAVLALYDGHRRTAPRRRRRGGRDHQERRERFPRAQAVVHQRDRLAVRGGRRRRRRGPGRDRRGSADRAHVHAPELRLRRELPPEGAHDAGRRRPGVRPADARHDGRIGCQPGRPGPVRRARPGRRRWPATGGRSACSASPSRPAPTTSATRRRSAWPRDCSTEGVRVRAYDPAAGPNAAGAQPGARARRRSGIRLRRGRCHRDRDRVARVPGPAVGRLGRPAGAAAGHRRTAAARCRVAARAGYEVIQLGDGRLQPGSPTPALSGSDR